MVKKDFKNTLQKDEAIFFKTLFLNNFRFTGELQT